VGVDSYDHWPAATSASAWTSGHLGATSQGLSYWAAFATAHGKLLSVPEWGSRPPGRNMGGDNAYYVTQMHAFFARNASTLAYESNFQGDGGEYPPPSAVPSAASAYLQAYRG
jgi:hypothetical protein